MDMWIVRFAGLCTAALMAIAGSSMSRILLSTRTRPLVLDSMRVSPNAQAMAQVCKRRVSRVVHANFPCRLKLLATILAEYRRGIAAARRYEDLKLHRESGVRRRHDIPRRIFEEFYSRA
jgi:hypothetical protein